MIKELIQSSKYGLDYFFDHLDLEKFQEIVELCCKTKGTIHLAGIGKSGFIAKKIAMTLVSTGTRAFFLDPVNLLHGDIGIVEKNDIVMLLSKSGSTKELVEIIPYLKAKGAVIIGVVSQENATIAKLADHSIILPITKELDQNDLVPTLSTQTQLIFGDCLTIALFEEKKVSLELYAQNHPQGAIGKKLLTKVEELMLDVTQVPFCYLNQSVKEVLIELTEKGCGCVLVKKQDESLTGLFTDGDLRRSLQKLGTSALECKIEELMNKNPIASSKEETILEAKKKMQLEPGRFINVLPILHDKKVVGLLRLHDILKAGL
jgi:arabinose-5-phosphate isomerase